MSEEVVQKQGIEETKQVLLALNAVSLEVIKLVKDGVQISDAVSLLAAISGSAELQSKVLAAVDNIQKVPEELKDLELSEGIELVQIQAAQIPAILAVLKK